MRIEYRDLRNGMAGIRKGKDDVVTYKIRMTRKNTYYSVKRILSNEVYVGDVIFRKKPSRNVITGEIDKDWQPVYMKDHHIGIVDRDVWDAAQVELKRRERKKVKAPKYTAKDRTRDRLEKAYGLIIEGKRTTREIAESMGLECSNMNYYLRKLEADGRIMKVGNAWEAV